MTAFEFGPDGLDYGSPPFRTWADRLDSLAALIGKRARRACAGLASRRRAAMVKHFDADYYLATYPDVARTGSDPLQHFLRHGWRECRNPNGWMSTAAYLRSHPELLGTGEDPLTHMARTARVARSPGAWPLRRARAQGQRSVLSDLIEAQPQFPIKWRSELYLARGLSDMERARSQLHTFAVLDALLPPQELRTLLFKGRSLWRSHVAAGLVEIRLSLAAPVLNEGELALSFNLFGRPLAVLSFSLFPGDPLDRRDGDRLFISRMQAMPETRALAKLVSKALGDVTLQAALFAAFQGVAEALGIERFIGVPAERQVSLTPEAVARCAGTYDAFYETVGAEFAPDGLYHGAVMADVRPLSSIKAGHKIRTREKRALKQAIRGSARAALVACTRGRPGLYEDAA